MASGVPDELYWRSTPLEVGALLDQIVDLESRRERAAALRAGLVASAVYNVHRRKGAKALKPSDFVAGPQGDEPSPAEFKARLKAFAATFSAVPEHVKARQEAKDMERKRRKREALRAAMGDEWPS